MIRRRDALTLCLTLAVGLASTAAAQEEEQQQEESLQVVLENGTDADGDPKGCFFRVRGKTQPLIDGAKLEVTLQAHGRSREFPIKIKGAVVQDRTYEVSHAWPDRVFAPLLYEVKVELNVRKQPRNVQQWIMTEYGYALTHQEILDRKRFGHGTDGERAEFALANIERIMGFVGDLQRSRAEVVRAAGKPAAEDPLWPEMEKSLNAGVIRFRNELDGYFRRYVVLLEQGFYARFTRTNSLLARIIRDHGRGQEGIGVRLGRLGEELVATRTLIAEHAPTTHEEALIPDEALPTPGEPAPRANEEE